MLIKYLKIEKNGEEVRRVHFKAGVNLIVDTTPVDSKTESGNNVGKTTVLRLIDYCLGGKAKTIYQDPEFKTTNSTVKNFLEKQNVIISLCLSESIDDDKCDILIRRNFLQRGQKLAEINGENYTSDKEYQKQLNLLLFNLTSGKPSFRELIPRFIRSDAVRMDKVIKYLHSTTTDNTYEGIYFFLFGRSDTTSLSSEKNELSRKLAFSKDVIQKTFQRRTAAAIRQHLSLIKADIEKLEKQKEDFNVNPQYEAEYQELQKIKHEINRVSSALSEKQFRLSLLQESIEELKKQTSEVDTDALQQLYKEAQHYVVGLQKSFDDAVAFHNKLIANKLGYISEDIVPLRKEITALKAEQDRLLKTESDLGRKLITTGSLADYELIVSNANKKYEQKGRLEEELEKLEALESDIETSNTRINEINRVINSEDSAKALEENITRFNQYFSSYSELFYDEKFALSASYDKESDVYKFTIDDSQGNLGDGKKKGLIAAFDLAYLSYANAEGYKTPRFVMHDRIEGIHGNQLKSLFDIVNSDDFDGQYIASVLSGKFSEFQLSDNYLENNKILELSQQDKLFRIEFANK